MQKILTRATRLHPRTHILFVLALFVLALFAIYGCDTSPGNQDDGAVSPPDSNPEKEAEEEEEPDAHKPKPKPKPEPEPEPEPVSDARVLASMTTQTNCDISTFFLFITGLELKLESGDYVNVLDAPMQVDLARLDARTVEQAFAISDIPSGTYTGARLTIDYSQSLAVLFNHDNMPGKQSPATLVDATGEPLTGTQEVTINVHGDTLVIAPGELGHLRLIANLAASAIADPVGNTLNWTPVFEAEFDPPRLRRLFAKAFLQDVSLVNKEFGFALMNAFEEAAQAATTKTNSSTVYQLVHGVFGLSPFVAQGVAGLDAMDDLPVGTPLLIDLRVAKEDGALLAECVNAGLGVETSEDTFVYGYVLQRDTLNDPTLLVHAILAYTPEHGYRYNIQLEVEVDSLTVPVLRECENKIRGAKHLNVGAKVVLFGEMNVKKHYKKVRYRSLLMSNEFCEEVEALARVLPVMLCGELLRDIDHGKAELNMAFCKVDCLDASYFDFAWAGIVPGNLWIDISGLLECKCDEEGDCICVYVFFRSFKQTTNESKFGKHKATALEIFCPCDTLILENKCHSKCSMISLINYCEIYLNLFNVYATLYPCNPCVEPKKLHKYLSHLMVWQLKEKEKYFSLYRDGVVDQFLNKGDFTDELLKRHLKKDLRVFRFWAYGVFDKKLKVFFAKHIVIVDGEGKFVPAPKPEPEVGPTVAFTFPQDGASDVPVNTSIVIGFDQPMNPDTINESTILVTANGTPISGTVTYDAESNVATFTPDADLPEGTVITVTVTTDVEDDEGNPMVDPYVFEFETGTEEDTTAPTVISEFPEAGAIDVPVNTIVAAGFSEPMDPSTINTSTFLLETNGTPVSGTVTWVGTTATFTPDADLDPNTTYTATITTGATDLAGNPIASDHEWSFTTGSTEAQGPAPVLFGTACNFTALAKTGISTTGLTEIMGDIGLSPAAGTFFTGFTNFTLDAGGEFATADEVDGEMFAADFAPPTPSMLTVAILDMEAAYTDAATRPNPDHIELGGGNLEGMTLSPGLYKWSSSVNIPTELTLDGGPDDVWIFQIDGDLVLGTDAEVIMQGGASAENVYWQVAGQAILGVGSELHGNILSQTAIIMQTGATLHGGAFAQSAITLDSANLTGK